MDPIKTLLDRQPLVSPAILPEDLHALYGGDLQFPAVDKPYVIANFAETLDGVVSYKLPGKSTGGDISGHNSCDRFIMALLRASADAVLVASATLAEVSRAHLWTPDEISPETARLFQTYRYKQQKQPLAVFVSGTGRIDVTRAVFQAPGIRSLIVTSTEGKKRIDQASGACNRPVESRAVGDDPRIPPEEIVRLLHGEFGARLILHEGGPDFFGQFLRQGLIDELFLTVAPQIAGRISGADRPAFVRNAAFTPEAAPWLKLISVKQSGNHLFLRYQRDEAPASIETNSGKGL